MLPLWMLAFPPNSVKTITPAWALRVFKDPVRNEQGKHSWSYFISCYTDDFQVSVLTGINLLGFSNLNIYVKYIFPFGHSTNILCLMYLKMNSWSSLQTSFSLYWLLNASVSFYQDQKHYFFPFCGAGGRTQNLKHARQPFPLWAIFSVFPWPFCQKLVTHPCKAEFSDISNKYLKDC
jgi:hypothetical protein